MISISNSDARALVNAAEVVRRLRAGGSKEANAIRVIGNIARKIKQKNNELVSSKSAPREGARKWSCK